MAGYKDMLKKTIKKIEMVTTAIPLALDNG